jgi:hypothetical protein
MTDGSSQALWPPAATPALGYDAPPATHRAGHQRPLLGVHVKFAPDVLARLSSDAT